MATLNQTTKPYGYENYRYAVFQYWLEKLPKREQATVRKQLARDMELCEQGAKFKAPRGHALASKAVELLYTINGR